MAVTFSAHESKTPYSRCRRRRVIGRLPNKQKFIQRRVNSPTNTRANPGCRANANAGTGTGASRPIRAARRERRERRF